MDYLLNAMIKIAKENLDKLVLNLIINGLPSKLTFQEDTGAYQTISFKPYYKWITF